MELIDRDELEEVFLKEVCEKVCTGEKCNIFPACCTEAKVIEEAPTVDAVPVVHGKWEFIDKYNVRCSVCLRPRNGKTQILWEYCPNCGAKMYEERRTE